MTRLDLFIKYSDGTVVQKELIGYKNIDRDKARFLEIRNIETNKVLYQTSVTNSDGFAYRRRVKNVNGNITDVCHVLVKFTKRGKKIAFVFDSNEAVTIKDTFLENTRWFYSPVFTEEETKGYMV